jgi:hypothetical protein
MRKYIFLLSITFATPFIADAYVQNVSDLRLFFLTTVVSVTRMLWLFTVLTFLWGLVKFMQKADSEKDRKDAKQMMIGSVIAFFIAVSFWGLVTFAIKAFNISPDSSSSVPIVKYK